MTGVRRAGGTRRRASTPGSTWSQTAWNCARIDRVTSRRPTRYWPSGVLFARISVSGMSVLRDEPGHEARAEQHQRDAASRVGAAADEIEVADARGAIAR